MSFVVNEWIRQDDETTVLRIIGVYSIDVLVATSDVPRLQQFSWCYEQAKGNVYTMDATMELPTLLGISSPRVYLWKYIVFLRTCRVAKAWRRANIDDYRFNHGTIVYIDPVVVNADTVDFTKSP